MPFAQISSRSRGVAIRAVACQVSPSIDTVACGLASRLWYQAGCFVPPKLGDSVQRDGAGFPRLGTRGGEDDRRNTGCDPQEAVPAGCGLGDDLVETVCRRAQNRYPHLRGRKGAHSAMKHVGIVKRPVRHRAAPGNHRATPVFATAIQLWFPVAGSWIWWQHRRRGVAHTTSLRHLLREGS